jgi:UDP-N-acetylglucosamine 2-epimerase (non-hydrolysing)
MQMNPVHVVIGTRAQLIKMAPVMLALTRAGISYHFLFTAQHRETIEGLLDEFGLDRPDVVLSQRGEASTLARFGRWWFTMLAALPRAKRLFPGGGWVLTHGDTATTLWAAVAGRLAGCRVVHIESGLRSRNWLSPFPEELIRLGTSRLAHLHYCPGEWAVENLQGYGGDKVDLGANTLRDAVNLVLDNPAPKFPWDRPYAIVSLHRAENILTNRSLSRIIGFVEQFTGRGVRMVFVLHPSTREALNRGRAALLERIRRNPDILLTERMPFSRFIHALAGAEFVLTDGGSNQEELTYLGVPTLLLRKATERQEGLGKNVVVSGLEVGAVGRFSDSYATFRRQRDLLGSSPSQLLAEDLLARVVTNPGTSGVES